MDFVFCVVFFKFYLFSLFMLFYIRHNDIINENIYKQVDKSEFKP